MIAVNSGQGYFDIDDGTVPAEMNTLQDIWDTVNYGSAWTAPDGLRVSWAGTMPTVGSQVALKGCVGTARKKLQVSTTINGGARDEVKIDKTYPLILADGWVAAFAVTGGGAYCSGGSGVAVGLSGSETGVNYQLYRDDTTAVGSPVAGTGSALNFGNQTVAGTYTVKGTRTGLHARHERQRGRDGESGGGGGCGCGPDGLREQPDGDPGRCDWRCGGERDMERRRGHVLAG